MSRKWNTVLDATSALRKAKDKHTKEDEQACIFSFSRCSLHGVCGIVPAYEE